MKMQLLGRYGFTVALAVVLALAAMINPAGAESIRLAAIGQNEVVTVIVASWGCFGYESKHRLTFRSHPEVPGAANVDIVNIKGIRHRHVATRVVPASELEALDAGLNVYRKPYGGCVSTHITRLRLRLKRDGDLVGEEMHYGNGCSVERVPGALDFEALIFRDDNSSQDGAASSTARHNQRVQRTHSRVTPRAEELHGSRHAARR